MDLYLTHLYLTHSLPFFGYLLNPMHIFLFMSQYIKPINTYITSWIKTSNLACSHIIFHCLLKSSDSTEKFSDNLRYIEILAPIFYLSLYPCPLHVISQFLINRLRVLSISLNLDLAT